MSRQGKYWMFTIPVNDWNPPETLPSGVVYIKGQQEIGSGETAYHHWQLIVVFERKKRLAGAKVGWPATSHLELTRSEAALEYVWKEETAVPGTRIELGRLPMKRNCPTDWDVIWQQAKDGQVEEIPSDIRIRCYSTIKRIRKDFERAPMREGIVVNVYWGVTGSGKSHKAFNLASESGHDFYVKGSTTKWWDGYKGEKIVIMDEFRGQIGIEHLLKWFDKYPCYVEEKGGQLALQATTFYVCSNLDPRDWFKDIDEETKQALLRRLKITYFPYQYHPPYNESEVLNELINFDECC